MKTIFSFIILLTLSLTQLICLAQRPDWVDYSRREILYPENRYLIGFHSEADISADMSVDRLEKMTTAAKHKLIESVQVKIESTTTFDIENTNNNGEVSSSEFFNLNSVSSNQLNLVGLKTETYYDEKKKEAFAFAYANKDELIAYYQNAMNNDAADAQRRLEEGNKSLEFGDLKSAFKSFVESLQLTYQVKEAHDILMVLTGNSHPTILDQMADIRTQANSSLNALFERSDLSLDDLSFFMSYALKQQLAELAGELSVQAFGYEKTGFTSPFSDRLSNQLSLRLTDLGGYQVQSDESKNEAPFRLEGTYWEEADRLLILANIIDQMTGQTVVGTKGYISKSWLDKNGIVYLPESLRKIQLLSLLKLEAVEDRVKLKTQSLEGAALEVMAKYEKPNGESAPATKIPIIISLIKGKKQVADGRTDLTGLAKCVLNSMEPVSGTQLMIAKLDLATYLGVEEGSEEYKKVLETHSIPSVRMFVEVSGRSVFLKCTETNLGKEMDVSIIEESVKETLREAGFSFTNDINIADVMVEVDATSQPGSKFQQIYFTYANVKISVMDLQTGDELYAKSFANVKQGGPNFPSAGLKAFRKVSTEVANELAESLSN